MRWLACAALLAALGGCMGNDSAADEGEGGLAPADLAGLVAGLPCEAPFDAVATTENLRRLDLTELDAGLPREMDASGDLLLVAAGDGFATVDLSDPARPQALGIYDAEVELDMLDVKFSPDNQSALLASWAAIDVVDIRDPANPV